MSQDRVPYLYPPSARILPEYRNKLYQFKRSGAQNCVLNFAGSEVKGVATFFSLLSAVLFQYANRHLKMGFL